MSKANLIGQTFGRLTVIEKSNKTNAARQTYWKCKCICGNECEVSTSHLRSGHTQSCGCLGKQRAKENGKQNLINIIGKTFGYLLVLERIDDYIKPCGKRVPRYKCQCRCGNITYVNGVDLKNGNTKSCGCLKTSYGEERISQLLQENNIPFVKEKTFKTCKLKSGRLARFDFYVDNKYLIEYDGAQHFGYTGYGWNTEENFKKTQEHDQFKNQWCKKNNILLIRIPYYGIDKITIEDLIETSKYKLFKEECV